MNLGVLEMNSKAEAKLANDVAMSESGCNNDELMGFIRARTGEPIWEKGKPALQAKAQELRGKPIVLTLQVGLEPDGYQAWLAAEAAKKAAREGVAGAPAALEMAPAPAMAHPLTATQHPREEAASPRAAKVAKLARLAADASPDSRAALEAAQAALYR